MCAIAGILGKIQQDDHEKTQNMLRVMGHRAPNGLFVEKFQDAVLGHGRLAVIDLSERSNQPFSTPDGRFTIVFNGAIYNYIELKKELSAKFEFRSKSDTEVLLAGYQVWGSDVLRRLRGMFAFCIFDKVKRQAFMARDRFGQKPFFFTKLNDQLVFASEVKAILKFGVMAKPNYQAIYEYLRYANYDHDEQTFFEGIFQLQPGECATWAHGNSFTVERYYKLFDNIDDSKLNYQEAVSTVKRLMFDTCNLHMRCDVPVGVSLSGGLDSSALLSCLSQARQFGDGVPSFFADFGEDYSEEPWARNVAGTYQSNFIKTTMSSEELERWIKPMIWHLEGPSGGLMNFALTKLMGSVYQNGLVVLQDGTGIDEACGGYKIHHLQYLGDLKNSNSLHFDKALSQCASHWGKSKTVVRKMVEQITNRNDIMEQVAIDGTTMIETGLLKSDFVSQYGVPQKKNHRPRCVKESFCQFLQSTKVPRNNRMKDRTSMAYGLEVRTPFLDHVFIETTLSMPADYLFHGGVAKSLVRDALGGYVDPFVAKSKKRSVHAPQSKWLRHGHGSLFVEKIINSDSFANRGIFEADKVKKRFADFKENGAENSFFVWQWVNVEMWFRTFVDCNTALNSGEFDNLKDWC